MDFRINLTVEVDQVGNGLAVATPIPMQLVYEKKQWRCRSATPPVETGPFDAMEAATIAGANRIAAELQGAVIERPLIAGKITPETINQMF